VTVVVSGSRCDFLIVIFVCPYNTSPVSQSRYCCPVILFSIRVDIKDRAGGLVQLGCFLFLFEAVTVWG